MNENEALKTKLIGTMRAAVAHKRGDLKIQAIDPNKYLLSPEELVLTLEEALAVYDKELAEKLVGKYTIKAFATLIVSLLENQPPARTPTPEVV